MGVAHVAATVEVVVVVVCLPLVAVVCKLNSLHNCRTKKKILCNFVNLDVHFTFI